MVPMKTLSSIVAGALLLGGAGGVFAGGGANSPPGYLTEVEGPLPVSVGAVYHEEDLGLGSSLPGIGDVMTVRHGYVVIGVDPMPWLTLHARTGVALLNGADDDSSGGEWGGGLRVSLVEYALAYPGFLGGSWGLEAFGEYTGHQIDDGGVDLAWTEGFGSFTLNWRMFSQDASDRSECHSLVLSAGVGMLTVDGDIGGRDLDVDGGVGFVGGGDIFLAENFSIGAEARVLDELSILGRLAYHF